MKVLLLTHVRNIGQKGEIKEVSNGYFQNFLAPKKWAVVATDSQVSHIRAQQSKAGEKLEAMKESALSIKAKLEGKVLNLPCKASEGGKLYASLHQKDLALALKEQVNVELPEKQIKLSEPIKSLGTFTAELELYKNITVPLSIHVVAE